MDKQRIQGGLRKATGTIKEKAGQMTRDRDLEAEGRVEKAEGRVRSAVGHAMYVHQNGGTGLYAANSPVNIGGITPYNAVSDPAGDGKYEVSGISSTSTHAAAILP